MYELHMLTQAGAAQIVEEGSGWVQALPAGLQALGCRLLDAQQLGSSLSQVTLMLFTVVRSCFANLAFNHTM